MFKRITITLTDSALEWIENIVAEHGFASKSEFVRYAIRCYADTQSRRIEKEAGPNNVPSFGIPIESIKEVEQEILKNTN